MPQQSPFSEEDLGAAIADAVCWADALRFLGYELKGANYRTRWYEYQRDLEEPQEEAA
jgi:hypothetical protein